MSVGSEGFKAKALAGRVDAVSLGLISISGMMLLPLASSIHPLVVGILAASGASGLAWSRVSKGGESNTLPREGFTLPSDAVEPPSMGVDGIRLGFTKDKGLPVDVVNGLMTRHTAIIGQSGVGKTTLIEYMLWQQTVRGGGWLFVDAKIDRDTRNNLAYMAKTMGREDELYILDISAPDESHTMNPLLNGDPDEVASRLMNLVPSSENNPGSDFYRQSANHALTVIIAALQRAKKLYHFGDLSILLQSPKALEALERMTPQSAERRSLSVFLDQFRTRNKNGVEINTDRLKNTLGGMSGRIALFAQGKFGTVFNVYAPEVVLESIVLEEKMLYVSLPTMGKDTAALNLGKMIVSDLRSAVANIQNMSKSARPKIPFMAVLDEMGAYVMEGVGRLFEQARSAGICLVPAFQSFSQLNKVSPDFADIVVQNTWTKIIFKFGTNDGAEQASSLFGEEVMQQKSINLTGSESSGSQALRTRPDSSLSEGGGLGLSWREAKDFRVPPDKVMALGMGESFVITGSRMYHMRSPMLLYPDDANTCEIARFNMRNAKDMEPLDFESRLDEFLLGGD